MTEYTTERVPFRLLHLASCCGTLICWVNPRLPNFCPECGTNIMQTIKESVRHRDDYATLKLEKTNFGFPSKWPEDAKN